MIIKSQKVLQGNWEIGKVIKISDETENTKRFWIQIDGVDRFDFAPGQFITINLPIHENPVKRLRSYSIASCPDDTNIFELLIVNYKNGLGTPYFFEEVKIGTEFIFNGPQGRFRLEEPLDDDIFMICTGTGVAPFRSMLHYIKNNDISHQNIYLIFGCRNKSDILYYDEMLRLENDLQDFHYIPTLSREKWDGQMGYVHKIYESLCINRKPALFLLSGLRDMVTDARKIIDKMGYRKIIVLN